jgi:hypothetical protein
MSNTTGTPGRDERDTDLIRIVSGGYRPPAVSARRRVAIDDRVWSHIERRRRLAFLVPAFASIAVAAAVIAFTRFSHDDDVTTVASRPATVAVANAREDSGWEYSLLFEAASAETAATTRDDLPDEYRAIAKVILEE